MFLKYGLSVDFFHFTVILFFLVFFSCTDLLYKKVPNKFSLLLLLWVSIFVIIKAFNAHSVGAIIDNAMGMLVGALPLLLASLLTKGRGMGAGDIKLMGILGFAFGFEIILDVLRASLISAVLIWMVLSLLKVVKLREKIPLVPFILLGVYFTLMTG